jgi:hypothetical protein
VRYPWGAQGKGPTRPKKTFGEIANLFVETDAKQLQRTWDQTERVLKKNCEPWLEKPIGEITRTDAYTRLRAWRSCRYRRPLSPWCRAKGSPASTQPLPL